MTFKFFVACGVAASMSAASLAQTAPATDATTAQAAPAAVAAVPAVPLAVQRADTNMLPSNSDIWVSLDTELNSKKARVGDTITFKVSRDVWSVSMS
jgi:hypothetical protein